MHNKCLMNATFSLLTLAIATPAVAHNGRRFEVKVVDNQLVAQGYISGGGAQDDGGGLIRPYYNALHGHFGNITDSVARADLPGFDVLDEADELIGYELTWTAVGFKRWGTPMHAGPVVLDEMPDGEVLKVAFSGVDVRSDEFDTGTASFNLLDNFTGTNGDDIDLLYDLLGPNPVGELFVIESVLSTNAPGIADSSTVYTILSPDGINGVERLHHQSLHAEGELGTPVPEPSSLALAALLPLLMRRRRA